MDPKQIMHDLQKPFPAEDIEWRVGATNGDKTKGIALAYITNRAIQSRLDELFGPFGWRNEFREWKGNSQLCGISVKFGDEWITKWDGADDSNTEATKGGLSDAMKRAGYQWGIGRYLYNLENIWCPIKPAGKSFALVSEPKLPKWALPEGYVQRETQVPDEPYDEPQNDHTFSTLKAKYQAGKGSLDGFEDWVEKQQAKGHTYQQMSDILAIALLEKNGKSEHLEAIEKETEQNVQSAKKETPGKVMKRVMDLRERLGLGWKDLNEIASSVLNREVKYPLKDHVKTADEWALIERALLEAKAS